MTSTAPAAQYTSHVGVVAQLQEGDFVDFIGGQGQPYKRYRCQARVEKIFRTQGQRTRCHLKLRGKAELVLRLEYPVEYRRPVTGAPELAPLPTAVRRATCGTCHTVHQGECW